MASKITAALVSGVNENTVAFANVSLDFSLFKVEAPVEFAGLGAALATQRRIIAEDGQPHQTARRLGALFEQLLPPTPSLIGAYGHRASEIARNSAVNPRGSQKHAMFADYIGADATSLWAAATSGISAIGVHLLACMLSRTWSGPEAVSIWVEIVEERKRLILERAESDAFNTPMGSLVAARHGLSRQELAQWDASARAWLQSADDAMIRQQKQLMLILNNLSLPVNQVEKTYNSVIEAWQTAMKGVERLITGQPQSVSDGAVLVGLASWSLYPDLLVLGNKITPVQFNDELINRGGILTIGLETGDSAQAEGVYWSLALSHLRYYGDPVLSTATTSRNNLRVSREEVHLLTLGSVLSGWEDLGRNVDDIAAFFVTVLDRIKENKQLTSNATPSKQFLRSNRSWLSILATTSERLLKMNGKEKESALLTIALGRRRGHTFLARYEDHPPPLFGLASPYTIRILSMKSQRDKGLVMMRTIAECLALRPEECIIRIQRLGCKGCFEYITALPHKDCCRGATKHKRWIETLDDAAFLGCNCHETKQACKLGGCDCILRGALCTTQCHNSLAPGGCGTNCDPECHSKLLSETEFQCENIIPDELCHSIVTGHFSYGPPAQEQDLYTWKINVSRATSQGKPVKDFLLRYTFQPRRAKHKKLLALEEGEEALCTCYTSESSSSVFNIIAGETNSVALFVRFDSGSRARKSRILKALSKAKSKPWLDIKTVTESIKSMVTPEALQDYMIAISTQAKVTLPNFLKSINCRTYNFQPFMRSLNALSIVDELYQTLSGATIGIEIISRPLHTAHWIPDDKEIFPRPLRTLLPRANALACVAMFDSGCYNLRPTEDMTYVMAISVRNSIYVSNALLSDPFDDSNVDNITLVVGNVGRTGMSLMVSPQDPRIKSSELNYWRQISHAEFDGNLQDSFETTSLHLSLTKYSMPLSIGNRGNNIDHNIAIVEAVISAHDRGKWVADLDILSVYQPHNRMLQRFTNVSLSDCPQHSDKEHVHRLTSLDSWEELLDIPEDLGRTNIGIVRAHDNWLARLAATCISVQKRYRTVLLPSAAVCWHCCCKAQWWWATESNPSSPSRSFTSSSNVVKEDEASFTAKSVLGDDTDYKVHPNTDIFSISALNESLNSKYEGPEPNNVERSPHLWRPVNEDLPDENSDSEGSISSGGTAIFTGEQDDDYKLKYLCTDDVLIDRADGVLPKVFIL